MLVKMKALEKKCIDSCDRHKKDWSNFCIAKDSYLAGLQEGLRMAEEHYSSSWGNIKYWGLTIPEANRLIGEDTLNLGSEMVEVELAEGAHQIGSKSTDTNE